jgi:hypothetical protein
MMTNRFQLSDHAKHALYVAITVAIIASTIVYTFFNPSQPEQFFALHLLGTEENGDLFPNNNANISSGTPITWRIGVQNHMKNTQYIALRIKLGNQLLSAPNQLTCTPALLPPLYEYQAILGPNQIYQTEFTWSITNITSSGQTFILDLLLATSSIKSAGYAVNGLGFRMIIELWTLNLDTSEFHFGWTTGSEKSCVWSQVWFNATMD